MRDKKSPDDSDRERPAGPYWDDPVYRYLSGQRRRSEDAGDAAEAERLGELMQQIVDDSLEDEVYSRLHEEAKDEIKRRKQRRKKGGPRPRRPLEEDRPPSVNVAELKNRIFNPHVSRENVIKALEVLPAAERRSTIAGLPPGLRRKLADCLKTRGR